MQTIDPPYHNRERGRTGAWRVLAAGTAAGGVSVAVNLAIRALVLVLLNHTDVPFPLALGADIIFTFLPSLLGTLLFLVLRRTTTRPLRRFTITATAVLVLSWIGPLALLLDDVIGAGTTLALLVMHTIPAVVLRTTLRLVDNRPSTPAQ